MKTQINVKFKLYLIAGLIMILGTGFATESFASPNNRRVLSEETEEQMEVENLLKDYQFDINAEEKTPAKLYKIFGADDELIHECIIADQNICDNEKLFKLLRTSDLLMEMDNTLYYKISNQ